MERDELVIDRTAGATAYEPCSNCNGAGIQDYGESIGDCSRCHGDAVVRARDSKGRFTTVRAAGARTGETNSGT